MTVGEGLVWTGQAFYFSRFLIQWMMSERAKRSVTPRVFWWLSLWGVLFACSGTMIQQEWLLVPAFVINAAVYGRNLLITKKSNLGPVPAALVGFVAASALIYLNKDKLGISGDDGLIWILIGVIGQAIFASRFIVQWYLSEKRGLSHFPIGFWWLSLIGAMLNLVYTMWLGKPEFIAGYMIAWLVPMRNILLERHRHAQPKAPTLP